MKGKQVVNAKRSDRQKPSLEELVEKYAETAEDVPYFIEELSDGGERNEMAMRQIPEE